MATRAGMTEIKQQQNTLLLYPETVDMKSLSLLVAGMKKGQVLFSAGGRPYFSVRLLGQEPLTVPYLLGLGTLPFFGWTGGTLCGALAGSVLPGDMGSALGVMLYGMFIAIVVPPAKKQKPVLAAVVLAMVCSCIVRLLPALDRISIVLCTVAAAGVCAALFPIPEEEESV